MTFQVTANQFNFLSQLLFEINVAHEGLGCKLLTTTSKWLDAHEFTLKGAAAAQYKQEAHNPT